MNQNARVKYLYFEVLESGIESSVLALNHFCALNFPCIFKAL